MAFGKQQTSYSSFSQYALRTTPCHRLFPSWPGPYHTVLDNAMLTPRKLFSTQSLPCHCSRLPEGRDETAMPVQNTTCAAAHTAARAPHTWPRSQTRTHPRVTSGRTTRLQPPRTEPRPLAVRALDSALRRTTHRTQTLWLVIAFSKCRKSQNSEEASRKRSESAISRVTGARAPRLAVAYWTRLASIVY